MPCHVGRVMLLRVILWGLVPEALGVSVDWVTCIMQDAHVRRCNLGRLAEEGAETVPGNKCVVLDLDECRPDVVVVGCKCLQRQDELPRELLPPIAFRAIHELNVAVRVGLPQEVLREEVSRGTADDKVQLGITWQKLGLCPVVADRLSTLHVRPSGEDRNHEPRRLLGSKEGADEDCLGSGKEDNNHGGCLEHDRCPKTDMNT
mmetsp:Transcript_54246/g.117292  ORF Transcript_54246/g.117292 Transcript_54246/m.117292 type:complete len:204 (+) Transcript_54246:2509-3120(+)